VLLWRGQLICRRTERKCLASLLPIDETVSPHYLVSMSANQKRIALPARVEPKVFFANERTFLSWLNFTVILGSLGVGLLNFGDSVGRISAGLFTFIAMLTMAYALVTYHWRAKAIRMRGSGPYDDRFGPTMLCIFLLVAVVVNFVLRIRA
jgi:uncharacterized membrane protein YidH (DUF202 family)